MITVFAWSRASCTMLLCVDTKLDYISEGHYFLVRMNVLLHQWRKSVLLFIKHLSEAVLFQIFPWGKEWQEISTFTRIYSFAWEFAVLVQNVNTCNLSWDRPPLNTHLWPSVINDGLSSKAVILNGVLVSLGVFTELCPDRLEPHMFRVAYVPPSCCRSMSLSEFKRRLRLFWAWLSVAG